ncbi:hypothetical protein BN1708_004729 [Verticillium longisporum]|uniref:Uncharacterized protein n=1 Tax=Verticillium longisporum TaxID=100787 RepID=A0A0G4M3A7_VERLO|nr:hypothetical protein BN1708_004729 [Verticillium longisporum]
MVSAPTIGNVAAGGNASAPTSSRASPAVGAGKTKAGQVNSNGYHPTNPQMPLSSMTSLPLDLSSVERRGQPTAAKEPMKKKKRPHGLEEAPTYCPTEEEWKDPFEYIRKITPEAKQFGLCKIIPPDSWNPEFAIDTERFHFRTRKQELNSVEGSTRANMSYLDALAKFHKQQGNNLHRLPYVDKKPLDLYRLKKAVEARGGFEKVCKGKKWAEIGRDLGYSGKIMSSLSTSLKNSYQKWLCPYEDYLRVAKPGVHQQLELENGGPYTPSPSGTPLKPSNVNTPFSARAESPARQASDALQATLNTKKEADRGFTAVNSGFTSVNRQSNADATSTPPRAFGTPINSAKNTPEYRPSGLGPATNLKRQMSSDSLKSAKRDPVEPKEDADGANSRRSKRLKKDAVPTVAGSHMSLFRPSGPRPPRDENSTPGEKCDGQYGFEEGGLYSLRQFQQKAADFKQGFFERKMPYDSVLKCHRPVTEEDVETEFWRLVADMEETVEVEYGADIHCTTHGSGFPTVEKHPKNPYSTDPWNLNLLPLHPESLFRHIKSDISGMTVPWVYVGMIFSTFCWHNEDHYAYSANYQHFGATKTWYGIPGEDAEKFETAMREAVPELFETQPDLLFQLVTLLTPEQLKKAGVRVFALDQRAGQFVITFPQAYHAGFNHGFNFNEAVNFAPCDWEPFGLSGRYLGEQHVLLYRRAEDVIAATFAKVLEKAHTPEAWEEKYDKMLEEEATPSLKSLRALLHEGERIPYDLVSLPLLREFVDRCNEWVEEATNYTVRKQQNRRKSDKGLTNRKSSVADQKERDARDVSNIYRLLQEAEHIGFDCPEILQLRERADGIETFQKNANKALEHLHTATAEVIEELLEEGRSFNVDIPEVGRLSRILDQLNWNDKARRSRSVVLNLNEVKELIEEGQRLEIPSYNDHLTYYLDQMHAGQVWEKKARELIYAEAVHYAQLEALSTQVTVNSLPVSQETLAAVDAILHKQREAHRQILDLTERSRHPDIRKRPKYTEVAEIMRKLEDLNSKPNGTLDLGREQKRHEDWMREGKKLFGKTNAPLHILKSHMEYVLERNQDCFDIVNDKPRTPAEPASREASPEARASRFEDSRVREVFCICRKVEAGMMIECELCHEWYHGKCLKIARGKVKDEDKYACPICDWRLKVPRDAARPKLEDLLAWSDKISNLPFQPEEEEVLQQIIDNAQEFRNHVAGICNPLVSTKSEADTQRFYLRKIEGAEILLAYETNFFRQELHKWCPVAPNPPPVLEVSKSTRKPRPTKLQKLLAQYGVDDPEDLPENMKQKAASLIRKAQNAEAAANAHAAGVAASAAGALVPPGSAMHPMFGHKSHQSSATPPSISNGERVGGSRHSTTSKDDAMDIDSGPTLHPGLFMPNGNGGPQLVHDNSSMSLEDRLNNGQEDGLNLLDPGQRSKALEILGRTDVGRKRAEEMYGPGVWNENKGLRQSPATGATGGPQDERAVDKMFEDLTNHDDDGRKGREPFDGFVPTAESFENERNGMDALLDGE